MSCAFRNSVNSGNQVKYSENALAVAPVFLPDVSIPIDPCRFELQSGHGSNQLEYITMLDKHRTPKQRWKSRCVGRINVSLTFNSHQMFTIGSTG